MVEMEVGFMFYDNSLIIGRVPKKIKDRTKEKPTSKRFGNLMNKWC